MVRRRLLWTVKLASLNKGISLPIEIIVMICGVSLCAMFYLAAEKIYDIHYKLKADDNPLSRIVTGDHKKLDDKNLWVRRYRAKVLFLMVMVIVVTLIRFLFFS